MKKTALPMTLHCILFCGVFSAVFSSIAYAGSLTPSLAPAPTMYTLIDIYNRISSGTAAGAHTLVPSAAPGSTMYTLDTIYAALPGGTTTSAAAGDVANGKTFVMRANGTLAFGTGTLSASGGHELPASGQVTSYATRDDAYNESQSVGFSSAARTMSFTMYNYIGGSLQQTAVLAQSSVTVDNRTGLMWLTDGNKTGTLSMSNAITWCQSLNAGQGYAGYTDWRLPNIRELLTIVNYQNSSPAIDTAKFRNIQNAGYWTSSMYGINGNRGWYVDLTDGLWMNVTHTFTYKAIAVRGGP